MHLNGFCLARCGTIRKDANFFPFAGHIFISVDPPRLKPLLLVHGRPQPLSSYAFVCQSVGYEAALSYPCVIQPLWELISSQPL